MGKGGEGCHIFVTLQFNHVYCVCVCVGRGGGGGGSKIPFSTFLDL